MKIDIKVGDNGEMWLTHDVPENIEVTLDFQGQITTETVPPFEEVDIASG